MSNTSQIFIIRFKVVLPEHLLDANRHRYVETVGGNLNTDINKAHRFTMPEANKWVHEQQWPSLWIVEYAPLTGAVVA